MLARENRLTSAEAFRSTMRSGTKHATAHIVIYLKRVESNSARFGFVVSKAVGSAVTRNLVKRRLREIARTQLAQLAGYQVVVRALDQAGAASFPELQTELTEGLSTLLRKQN